MTGPSPTTPTSTVPLVTNSIEQCREKVYSKLLTKFISRSVKQKPLVLLLTPPLFLSEQCLSEARKTFDYLTFYDIAKNPEHGITQPVLLHLYLPLDLSKESAKLLQSFGVVFAGYMKEGISCEQMKAIIATKLEEVKGGISELNKVDRNYAKIKPDRLEILHGKIAKKLKAMFKQLDNEGVTYNVVSERSEKLIELLKEQVREEKVVKQ